MTGILVLVRHGQSEWNLKNLFTGWRDPNLTELGIKEAKQAGEMLKNHNITFQCAFTSMLKRAQDSCKYILQSMDNASIPIHKNLALNERDYGNLSGLNKDEARAEFGEEQIQIWRRSYDTPPPGGESLRDTAARVLPYYIHNILPELLRGKKVLITAHGNSLRALIMALEGLSGEEIVKRELETGRPIIYYLKDDNTIANKITL